MEKNLRKCIYLTDHFAVLQKITYQCKSAILKFKKKNNECRREGECYLATGQGSGNQFKSFSSAAPQVQQFPDGYTSVSSK